VVSRGGAVLAPGLGNPDRKHATFPRGVPRSRCLTTSEPLTVIVAGTIAGDPLQGGTAWSVLQYVLGLRELGHDVYMIEQVAPRRLRPAGSGLRKSATATYFRNVVRQFGLQHKSALLLTGSPETVGCTYEQLKGVASRADLLINISGILNDPTLLERIATRLFVDLDPGFTQLGHASAIDVGLERHTHFATIGLGMGDGRCSIPTCDRTWIPTRQPVVLEEWRPADHVSIEAFTTTDTWRGYGSITHDGVFYGHKTHALRQFMTLPARSPHRMLLALANRPEVSKDLSRLAAEGWQLVDPEHVAGTPYQYREFIQGSLAEFGIAKSGYTTTRCGWFSDRSVCYLASGRPVLAQETGFSAFLPIGEGLIAFETEDDVLAAMEAVVGDYARHSRAAREIAEQYFDANLVLPMLLNRVGGGVGRA
jgi:hypothetical protein